MSTEALHIQGEEIIPITPIRLSETQADLVYSTIRLPPAADRERFLVALKNTLAGEPQPVGDGALWRSIRDLQKSFWKPPPVERPAEHRRRKVGSALLA
jgi:hypothetical protein